MVIRPAFPNGKCKGSTDLFFPTLPFTAEERSKEKRAKALCGECIHLTECATYAIKHEEWGIWGGMTEKERQRIRRSRKIILDRPEREIVDANRQAHRKATFARKANKKKEIEV